MYKCNFCPYVNVRKDLTDRHEKQKCLGVRFKCDCGALVTKSALARHKSSKLCRKCLQKQQNSPKNHQPIPTPDGSKTADISEPMCDRLESELVPSPTAAYENAETRLVIQIFIDRSEANVTNIRYDPIFIDGIEMALVPKSNVNSTNI